MELKDFYITPIFLLIFYSIAYAIRPSVTNIYTKKYFLPAFSVKIVGAIALGILYHTLYGGDTNNYYRHAGIIYEAFGKSFGIGWELLTSSGEITPAIQPYVDRMTWFAGGNEYPVIRTAAFFGLFCFNTYTVISLFFAIATFSGMWAMYMTFARIRPHAYQKLAIAVFFLPSVFFWGSGLLKDSLCIGALGWLFYAFYRGAIEKRNLLRCTAIGFFAITVISSMKIYILLAFLPPALLWVFNQNAGNIRNPLFRWLAKPLFIGAGAFLASFAIAQISAADNAYAIENIAANSKKTSDYLVGVSKKENGSGYNLGEQDGSIGSMVRLAPQAIVVSLFRPFIWESRNATMALSALESSYFIFLTLRIFLRVGFFRTIKIIAQLPIVTMCFIFSIIFAFSVGLSSGNFGTLVRYKIPLMPFYLSGLYIMESYIPSKKALRQTAIKSVSGQPQLA